MSSPTHEASTTMGTVATAEQGVQHAEQEDAPDGILVDHEAAESDLAGFRFQAVQNAFVISTRTGTNSMRPTHIRITIANRVVRGKLA